jgi:hypothetical protein
MCKKSKVYERPSLRLKLKADVLLLLNNKYQNNIFQKYQLIEYYFARNALSFKRYTFYTLSHPLSGYFTRMVCLTVLNFHVLSSSSFNSIGTLSGLRTIQVI